jgi:CheY-like chemotaxis protein/HPt (histidine-containing phosphotransfer) domain-containing protein
LREGSNKWLAGVSDCVRTPLNQLLTQARLLLDTKLDPDQRDRCRGILAAAETVANDIDDLLDYLTIEAGRLKLEQIDFDLRVMMDGVTRDLLLRASERGVQLTTKVHHTVPSRLCGDPGRLRQILNSLAGHAIRLSKGGEVSLAVDVLEETDKRANLRFGVSASEGVESGDTEDGGLGVAIAHHLTAMMEGRVGLEQPEEGEGFSVWFTATVGKQVKAEHADAEAGDVTGQYVLVVSDDPTTRAGLVEQLCTWGCRLAEAVNAKEALTMLRTASTSEAAFTVALIDLCSTGGELVELAREVMEHPRLAQTRLALLTAVAQRGDAARMKDAGYSAYLSKPLSASELKTSLAALAKPDSTEFITRHWLAERRKHALRILLVENNPVNRKLGLRILDRLGYRVDAVATGAEALEILSLEHRDLVVMAVQLPEPDGLATARRIRAAGSGVLWHDIPVIGITTRVAKENPESCITSGMDDCLVRPLEPEDLRQAIERQLQRQVEPAVGGAPMRVSALYNRRELLERLDGDEQLCHDVLRTFLEASPPLLEGLRKAVDVGDRAEIERHAHTLMDAAANVSAEGIRSLAYRLEAAGRSGPLAEAAILLDQLEQLLQRLKTHLGDSST